MFVKAYTRGYLYFNNAATNRAEGINYSIKFNLPYSRGNLQELLHSFKIYINNYADKLVQSLEDDRTNRYPRLRKNQLYSQCWGTISHFTIKKVKAIRA
jgi:hypothetical protein